MLPKLVSNEKMKSTPKPKPSWELAIADAEERIVRLHRSIELFKQNSKEGIAFPGATQN